jgi:translation initiation factor 1
MKNNKVVYQEFDSNINNNEQVFQRGEQELPPQQQNVRVQTSRSGRKGKTVTIINGFQTSEVVLNQLLKDLKAKCGSGGTIKDDTLEIQGDHKQKILEILLKLGYKAKISGG